MIKWDWDCTKWCFSPELQADSGGLRVDRGGHPLLRRPLGLLLLHLLLQRSGRR